LLFASGDVKRSPTKKAERTKSMRITRYIMGVILVISLSSIGYADKPPRRHYEESGGFSYNPPSGWQIVEFPGLKYRVSHGPVENGFAPNINVVDEEFSGTLAAYVDGSLENMERIFAKFKVLSRENLKTHDNEAGVKIITENEQQGRMLRQTFFFIGSGDRKYVVTCSTTADDGAEFDSIFSEIFKTFRIH
jgi:hypothetical protein